MGPRGRPKRASTCECLHLAHLVHADALSEQCVVVMSKRDRPALVRHVEATQTAGSQTNGRSRFPRSRAHETRPNSPPVPFWCGCRTLRSNPDAHYEAVDGLT